MKHTIRVFIFSLLLSIPVFAQEMQPPPPIDNKFFDASVGSWVSDPYEMMGMKWTDEANVEWALNKHFLVLKVTSKSDKNMAYEQIGYMSADKDGNVKMWFFDTWGMDAVTEFTGKTDGLTCTIDGGNKFMKNSGKITINGADMTQEMKYTMPGEGGKETSGELKVIYKKK